MAKLMSIDTQRDPRYHEEKFLRGRLINAMDSKSVQVSLRDRIPRTAPKQANGIANQLFDKSNTAGAYSAHFAPTQNLITMKMLFTNLEITTEESQKKIVKLFGGRDSGTNSRGLSKVGRHKRLSPSYMSWVKRCFGCRKVRLARQHHSEEQLQFCNW